MERARNQHQHNIRKPNTVMKIPTVLLTAIAVSTLSLAPATRAEPLANTKKRAGRGVDARPERLPSRCT